MGKGFAVAGCRKDLEETMEVVGLSLDRGVQFRQISMVGEEVADPTVRTPPWTKQRRGVGWSAV